MKLYKKKKKFKPEIKPVIENLQGDLYQSNLQKQL